MGEELRALIAAATDEDLTDGGRYFDETFTDLTRCRHEEIGEYQNRRDGPLIEWLWNHRRETARLLDDLAARDREIAGLREALKPFAEMADGEAWTRFVADSRSTLRISNDHGSKHLAFINAECFEAARRLLSPSSDGAGS